MFWSKIWFFLVALAGAVAVAVALAVPRPGHRAIGDLERARLQTACSVVRILLASDARNRVDLAGAFARSSDIVNALEAASGADRLDEARMRQVRATGDTVMKAILGARKPDFAILIDRRGRVVARVRVDDQDFGDVMAGRPLIDDALAGYLRDDVWAHNATLYFVAAAPVVKHGGYVGAVVLGHQATNELATKLVGTLDVDVGFHLGADGVAGSKTIAFDHSALTRPFAKLGADAAGDCQAFAPINVRAGADEYTAVAARLPGEAAARPAYVSVLIHRPTAPGFFASLWSVTSGDLAGFPWIALIGGFLVVLGGGIALMLVEADRPTRRLAADAVRLAKGDADRLAGRPAQPERARAGRSVPVPKPRPGAAARRQRACRRRLRWQGAAVAAVAQSGAAHHHDQRRRRHQQIHHPVREGGADRRAEVGVARIELGVPRRDLVDGNARAKVSAEHVFARLKDRLAMDGLPQLPFSHLRTGPSVALRNESD